MYVKRSSSAYVRRRKHLLPLLPLHYHVMRLKQQYRRYEGWHQRLADFSFTSVLIISSLEKRQGGWSSLYLRTNRHIKTPENCPTEDKGRYFDNTACLMLLILKTTDSDKLVFRVSSSSFSRFTVDHGNTTFLFFNKTTLPTVLTSYLWIFFLMY